MGYGERQTGQKYITLCKDIKGNEWHTPSPYIFQLSWINFISYSYKLMTPEEEVVMAEEAVVEETAVEEEAVAEEVAVEEEAAVEEAEANEEVAE